MRLHEQQNRQIPKQDTGKFKEQNLVCVCSVLYILLNIFVCVAGCSMPVKVEERPTVGLFSSSPVGPRDLTQVVGLGKCIYLQTHLMRTLSFFFF